MGGDCAAVCPHCEVARHLETQSSSSNISLSLWALKESLAFMCCGGISQKAPLEREKVRANHVELEQHPHNHECTFSDIIKMHRALKQGFHGLIVLKRKMNLEK